MAPPKKDEGIAKSGTSKVLENLEKSRHFERKNRKIYLKSMMIILQKEEEEEKK